MTFEAKIIESSVSQHGVELLTYQLRYPRFIHAEFMTHRVFSRNASSSRAIPVSRMVAATTEDPAFFVHIGKNQPGMQASEEVSPEIAAKFAAEWRELMLIVAGYVTRWGNPESLGGYGIHKQIANRPLEAWQHINVVVTSTQWDNFFELRDHPDAQPEIEALAQVMRLARDAMVLAGGPTLRGGDIYDANNWHLPYVSDIERLQHRQNPQLLAKLSAARCARTSYLTHDGAEPRFDEDLALYERLVGSRPLHASPIEHQALPASFPGHRSGNLHGWIQNRQMVESRMPRPAIPA